MQSEGGESRPILRPTILSHRFLAFSTVSLLAFSAAGEMFDVSHNWGFANALERESRCLIHTSRQTSLGAVLVGEQACWPCCTRLKHLID